MVVSPRVTEALHIGRSHCPVRLVICNTLLKFSAIINYYQTSLFLFKTRKKNNAKYRQIDFLSCTFKPEMRCSSDLFVTTQRTNQTLFCLGYLVQLLMNFKNLWKMLYFKKCVKIYFSQNFKFLVFFEVSSASLLPTALKFDIKLHSKLFFFKQANCCIFKQKDVDWNATFLKGLSNFA